VLLVDCSVQTRKLVASQDVELVSVVAMVHLHELVYSTDDLVFGRHQRPPMHSFDWKHEIHEKSGFQPTCSHCCVVVVALVDVAAWRLTIAERTRILNWTRIPLEVGFADVGCDTHHGVVVVDVVAGMETGFEAVVVVVVVVAAAAAAAAAADAVAGMETGFEVVAVVAAAAAGGRRAVAAAVGGCDVVAAAADSTAPLRVPVMKHPCSRYLFGPRLAQVTSRVESS
jgi:hypothetical protein